MIWVKTTENPNLVCEKSIISHDVRHDVLLCFSTAFLALGSVTSVLGDNLTCLADCKLRCVSLENNVRYLPLQKQYYFPLLSILSKI